MTDPNLAPTERETKEEPTRVAHEALAPHIRDAGASRSARPPDSRRERSLTRRDVYRRPIIDGREVPENPLTRLREWVRELLISQAERDEAELEHKLRSAPGVTRTNTIAVLSPKGGVGKTTCTFLLGNLLSSHLNLRCVAIDANPDFGTLGSLAPDGLAARRSLAGLVAEMPKLTSAAELQPYVSRLPSGLHLLAAPPHAEVMAHMTPELYGRLTAFLSQFYEIVLLDLGTGITGPLAQFGIQRADQIVVVTTPEYVTATGVLGALRYLKGERASEHLTVVLNQARDSGDRQVIEAHFRRQHINRRATIPYDVQLRTMLDSGTYTLQGLPRHVRVPIKQLGLAVTQQLV